MDGTATINAKVDSLRLCGFVQNLACAKPRRCGYCRVPIDAVGVRYVVYVRLRWSPRDSNLHCAVLAKVNGTQTLEALEPLNVHSLRSRACSPHRRAGASAATTR